MILDMIKGKEIYIGRNISLNQQNIEYIDVDELVITKDKSKTLFTNDLHFCICVLVIGEEIGMCHLDIQNRLNIEQQRILKQLLAIKDIKEIDAFVGPKTSLESLNELNKYIPSNNYLSYINNPLGLEVSTGNIAYNINSKELYGYNDDGFVEYNKGYINALNIDELTKKM